MMVLVQAVLWNRGVALELGKRRAELVRGDEQILRAVLPDGHIQVHLIRRQQLRDLHKERVTTLQHMSRADLQNVMPDGLRVPHGKLR